MGENYENYEEEYYDEQYESEDEEYERIDYDAPDLLMAMSLGDDGPVPITKLGGVPWWPEGAKRPYSVDRHPMWFIAQIRIDEIPGFNQPPTLLSFHYCEESAYAGKMTFGWRDRGDQLRYSVRLFNDLTSPVDGLGEIVKTRVEPRKVMLHEGNDVLKGLEGRSKLGGAPHWWQDPEYPEDDSGEPMKFVGQFGFFDFPDNAWSNGGVFLFVSEYDENEEQQADMILQST